jgi:adenylate cyclase
MAQVTIYVYAFDGARWTVQQTFPERQRDQATEWAHELYGQSHIKGVRVVQETYDEETGDSREKTLLTRTKSDDVPKSLNKEVKADKPAAPPKAAPAKKPAVVASRPVDGIPGPRPAAAPSASRAAHTLEWARTPGGRAASMVAASGSLVAGSALLVLQMPSESAFLTTAGAVMSPQTMFAVAIILVGTGLAGFGFVFLDIAGQRGFLPGALYLEPAVAVAGASPVRVAMPVMPAFPIIELEPDDMTPAAAQNLPPDALQAIAFFHDCLAALPRDGEYLKNGKLDAFNWFGCHLFFAGLCEDDARRQGWAPSVLRQVIATAMTAALADPANAARFAARYEDFLTDPRHLAMFGSGTAAARQRAAGDLAAAQALVAALAEWNRKPETGPPTGHVAVMFTDIVGSTEFTQAHGDAKHYEMVQAHDQIVRAALEEFSGREIKHTGDGIMAAFDDAGLGVRAAQRIQREIRAHRDVAPEIGMQLRIGLAAGEPIKAGADLFGSTVQLAARVCAVATGDQVVITEPVRAICEALGLSFSDLGEQALKGFKQPVRVHAVMLQ